MATTDDLFDHALLVEMVEQKMVRLQQDPATGFWILNYTAAAQYTSTWNDVTRKCRGLIVASDPMADERATIVARPFEKFFNLSEHDEGGRLESLPLDRPFEVFGKMDGSLGILYPGADGPAIATRGSFSSEQALWATNFLRAHLDGRTVPDGVTLLFEIIYPSNRIVVDYGDHEGLTYLGAIDNETGADVEPPAEWAGWLPRARHYDGITDIDEITAMIAASPEDWLNHEGFVLRFAPATPGTPSPRVKAKFSDYVRLHRIITGVSSKTVWEHLSAGQDLQEMLDHVPDEFYAWVQQTVADLQSEYRAIEESCRLIMQDERVKRDDRKATAEFFVTQPHKAVLFKMLDERDYGPLIWRTIKPVTEKPFRVDPDA